MHPDTKERQALFAEWHLQRAERLLQQGETRRIVEILKKARRVCRRDPVLKARRLLILASASLDMGQIRKTRRYLEQIQRLRCVHQDFALRFWMQSLQAQLARKDWIPSHVVWYHGQAIMTGQTGNSPAIELAERLNLAESFRQFGWVEEAAAQLKHVAIEAGRLVLPNLYVTSLMQLAGLYLNMGWVSDAIEVVDLVSPLLLLNPEPWHLAKHIAWQIRKRFVRCETEENEQPMTRPPLVFGPNSVLLQAVRVVYRIQKDYHLMLSLEGSPSLWSRVVPLTSRWSTEHWLSEFLAARQRWSKIRSP